MNVTTWGGPLTRNTAVLYIVCRVKEGLPWEGGMCEEEPSRRERGIVVGTERVVE